MVLVRGTLMTRPTNMNKYLLTCKDGGYGWGETGQRAEMCAPDEEYVKQHIPGGWEFQCLGVTFDRFFLKHLSVWCGDHYE